MNNLETNLMKAVLLASGAVLGTLLARWCDELLTVHSQEQSDHDKTRYAQGLAPLEPQSPYAQGLTPLPPETSMEEYQG